ncbi:MAG: hypothetical protein D6813_10035 [Calditrichaeota bacterium]|nr:MAG: hypothetical protein D6813_10035 [Calditrichota bacterium]
MGNRNYLPALVFISLCIIWGSTWIFIKLGLQDAPPFLSAGMRFVVATLILFPLLKWRDLKIPREWKVLSIMLYTGIFAISVSYGLVYWSEQFIPAGLTAVLFSTMPFFVIILSHFMLSDDPLTINKIAGSVLGFSGVIVIFIDSLKIENPMAVWGTVGVVFASFCSAVSDVIIKKHSRSLHPIVLTTVQMFCGAVILFLLGVLFEDFQDFRITWRSVGSIVYLAVMGTSIAFIGFYWLIRQIRVSTASLLVFVIPIVALFLDWLIFGEVLNFRVWIGSFMVLGGIGIAVS